MLSLLPSARVRLLGAVLPAAALLASSAAHANDVTLWPAPALFAPDADDCVAGAAAKEGSNRSIDRIFCPLLQPADQAAIGKAFADAVHRHFPKVEQHFGDSLPANASATRKLRNTLAISLRLTRASVATVPKPAGVDAYLPITLTVDVTNVASGEVVFTKTETMVGEGVFSAADLVPELQRQFRGQLDQAMIQLVARAATEFKPTSQSAQVVDAATGADREKLWILDKGRNAGLRAGDSFGDDGRIIYAGASYAILDTVLDDLKIGRTVSRTIASSAASMARPSVLVVAEATPTGYNSAWVEQVFEDNLGASTSLAPMPVNSSFVDLRRIVLGAAEADLPSDSRSLPDYVASVRLIYLDRAQWPSGVTGITIDRYAAHAFVTLFDHNGLAVGTAHGSAVIDDKISGNMRFSEGQRRDAVVRNALVDAAKKISSFKPQSVTLPVQKGSDGLSIADKMGIVPLGLTLPVLRPIGKAKGSGEEILMPVGQINIIATNANGVLAADAGVTPMKLGGREVVAMETGGEPKPSRHFVTQCTDANSLPIVEDRNELKMWAWPLAAENIAASQMNAPIASATLTRTLKDFAPSFAGFSGFKAAQPVSASFCYTPIVALQPSGAAVNATIGFTIQQNGARLTAIPSGASEASMAIMLQQDLIEKILPTARNAAKRVNFTATTPSK